MYLTPDEEKMYQGEDGAAVAKCMEILVALGDIYGAENMVEIQSAQISGVSFKTIGEAGLEFLEDLVKAGAKVRVPSTLNPAGLDLEKWEELGFSPYFAENQLKIVKAYQQMGVTPTCTCTPYLVGNVPLIGSHIAWSESSAVCYANSVIGARTNREGGPGALSAAICGRTPNYGYHLTENRLANLIVEINTTLTPFDYGTVGYIIGKVVKDGVPYLKLKNKPSADDLKSLGAALASSGAVALYHVEGVTPEYQKALDNGSKLENMTITKEDLIETQANMNRADKTPDLICLGCPHASLEEINKIANKIRGRRLRTPVWIFTSISIKAGADRMGLTKIIEKAGGKIVTDTCMVVAPMEELGIKTIGVDSAKAASYAPTMCGVNVVYDNIDNLLQFSHS